MARKGKGSDMEVAWCQVDRIHPTLSNTISDLLQSIRRMPWGGHKKASGVWRSHIDAHPSHAHMWCRVFIIDYCRLFCLHQSTKRGCGVKNVQEGSQKPTQPEKRKTKRKDSRLDSCLGVSSSVPDFQPSCSHSSMLLSKTFSVKTIWLGALGFVA